MSGDIITTVYGEKRNLLPYLKCYGFGAPVPGPRGDFAKLQTGGSGHLGAATFGWSLFAWPAKFRTPFSHLLREEALIDGRRKRESWFAPFEVSDFRSRGECWANMSFPS